MILDHLVSEEQEHILTVQAEKDRKQKLREEEEKEAAIKLEAKNARRAAREEKRRKEELAKLRAEIETDFIAKGTSLSIIENQELSGIDGYGESRPIVGGIGGVLGQMVLVLSIMEKNFNR